MNIHVNKDVYDLLINATIYSTEIGSTMYGTNDINSDRDILNIYCPSISEQNSFCISHHQFQYKDIENNIDYIFVNINTFIRNCLNGDSTINIETIFEPKLKESILSFLYDMRYDFLNYKIIRSYLGFANRDLKDLNKQKTNLEKNKKLAHVYRGLQFASDILDNCFESVLDKTAETYKTIMKIKNLETDKERFETFEYLRNAVSEKRIYLNKLYDSNDFKYDTYMSVDNQRKLDNHLSFLISRDEYKYKSKWVLDMGMFYNANEFPEFRYD